MPKAKRNSRPRRRSGPPVNPPRLNIVAVFVFIVTVSIGAATTIAKTNPAGIIGGVILGLILMQSPKVAKQWERAIVLRLGKYRGLRGPGLFWIVPFLDSVTMWIDQRVITNNFNAEETLTSDTVPVNVDAVLFWMVYDRQIVASATSIARDMFAIVFANLASFGIGLLFWATHIF